MNKKYKSLYFLPLAFVMFACGGEAEETSESAPDDSVELIEDNDDTDLLASTNMDPRTFGGEKNENQDFIDGINLTEGQNSNNVGSYVGSFGKNMINISIFEMTDGKASGYSVCAGNFRKITGSYEENQEGSIHFLMEEPGDDKYDGSFDFELITREEFIEGSWTPFNEGQSSKEFQLSKKLFSYNASVGKYPQASQRELTSDDVNNLTEDELTEMRNEIYARHGYSFKNKDWRYHFEALDWYMPTGVDIREKLTDTEVINIELIYEYESYFEEYYDDYGR